MNVKDSEKKSFRPNVPMRRLCPWTMWPHTYKRIKAWEKGWKIAEREYTYSTRAMTMLTCTERSKLQVIERDGEFVGYKFACCENDNEINFYPVEGDSDEGEFHFGHFSGVDGWTVIGTKDLKLCLMELGITVE